MFSLKRTVAIDSFYIIIETGVCFLPLGKCKLREIFYQEEAAFMNNNFFYVTIRDNYEKDREDYFPYIAPSYMSIAKNFSKKKQYPVLAVKPVTLIADDAKNIETAQFLVPTENGNFIWVQSEIFKFAGINS